MSILGYFILSVIIGVLGLLIELFTIVFRKKLAPWLFLFLMSFGLALIVFGVLFGASFAFFMVPRVD